MGLLQSLGITDIFWAQLLVALVFLWLLLTFVFEPFTHRYQKRLDVTEGIRRKIELKKPFKEQLFKEYSQLLLDHNRELESLKQRLEKQMSEDLIRQNLHFEKQWQELKDIGQERLRQWESDWIEQKVVIKERLKKAIYQVLFG